MPRYAYLEHEGPIAFAHRGGASDAPENTLPAFQSAIDLGYRYLETDVQLTADGVLVAFHDDDLARTTGVTGKISAMPWTDVRAALVSGKEPIPLLEDLLGSFPDARLNIDCKADNAVEALASAITRTSSVERVCVGAFSTRRIHRLRKAVGPALCTSMGTVEVFRWWVGGYVPGKWPTPAVPCAQVPVAARGLRLVTARGVAEAHRRGVAVHVWTIDDPVEMERLLDLGVDGIMTDRPAVLKEVLERRGLWH